MSHLLGFLLLPVMQGNVANDYRSLSHCLQMHLPAALRAPVVIVLTKADLAPSEVALRQAVSDLEKVVGDTAVSVVVTSGKLFLGLLTRKENFEWETGLAAVVCISAPCSFLCTHHLRGPAGRDTAVKVPFPLVGGDPCQQAEKLSVGVETFDHIKQPSY